MTRAGLIKRVAVCVVLGLFTAWLVAWGFAFRHWPVFAPSAITYYYLGELADEVSFTSVEDSVTGVQWRWFQWGWVDRYTLTRKGTRIESFDQVTSGWGLGAKDLFARAVLPKSDVHGTTVRALGWPLPALWSVSDYSETYSRLNGALVFDLPPGPVIAGGQEQRQLVLPYLPVWRGLLVDTALFSGIWAVFLMLTPAERRRRRLARGLCPRCGYDLCGSIDGGCPECGWGRSDTEG